MPSLSATALDADNRQSVVNSQYPAAYPTASPAIHPTWATPTADEIGAHTSSVITMVRIAGATTFTDTIKAACEEAFAAQMAGADIHADMVSCTVHVLPLWPVPSTSKFRTEAFGSS
jgi:hypothetical protein